MKRVQVEPHLSVTGACSAEWVPIKPKTDAAFLYALIHVLLHEEPQPLDLEFLYRHTSSPYLVGAHGYYLRDPLRAADHRRLARSEGDARGARDRPDGDVLAEGRLEGETASRSFSRT